MSELPFLVQKARPLPFLSQPEQIVIRRALSIFILQEIRIILLYVYRLLIQIRNKEHFLIFSGIWLTYPTITAK